MKWEVLIVGRGGQGVLLLGHIIGVAAAKYAKLYVTGTEAYASETRGGESRSDVIISDNPEDVDFVKVRSANVALFMYPYNIDSYLKLLNPYAYVFIDTTYFKDFPKGSWKLFKAPYTEIAEKSLGNPRVSNVVALGHIISKTKMLNPEHIEKAIKELVPEKWVNLNIEAFRKGLKEL